MTDQGEIHSSIEERLLAVLRREAKIEAFTALIKAYKPEDENVDLATSAIVLDSNVFIRLGPAVDAVDYLRSKHLAPVILPGQSVQEFWNNNLRAVATLAESIERKVSDLQKEIDKLDDDFGDFGTKFSALLDEFKATYGHTYDKNTVRRTLDVFEMIEQKAIVEFVSREKFSNTAAHRRRTKTPPGFNDQNDGDFFVWADTLQSLLTAQAQSLDFSSVVFVTNDKKSDWSINGVAHPILCAEIMALVGRPFHIWDSDKLVREVAKAS